MSLDQPSHADDDAAWPGLKVSPDEVTQLPFDFAAGQLDPDNLFDPEMGALRLRCVWCFISPSLDSADSTHAWCSD